MYAETNSIDVGLHSVYQAFKHFERALLSLFMTYSSLQLVV